MRMGDKPGGDPLAAVAIDAIDQLLGFAHENHSLNIGRL